MLGGEDIDSGNEAKSSKRAYYSKGEISSLRSFGYCGGCGAPQKKKSLTSGRRKTIDQV